MQLHSLSTREQPLRPERLEHGPCPTPAALGAQQPEPGTAQGSCAMKRPYSNCSGDRLPPTDQDWDKWPTQVCFSLPFTSPVSRRLSLLMPKLTSRQPQAPASSRLSSHLPAPGWTPALRNRALRQAVPAQIPAPLLLVCDPG